LLKSRDGTAKYTVYSIIVDFARGFCLHWRSLAKRKRIYK
jgi:hypothetical protein